LAENHPTKRRAKGRFGPENNFWKGGRSVASNGYVLVKANGHRLADVRGYAYEHRLVAEAKLGRELKPGEQVHHINGNRQDNRPENLEVVASQAEHRLRHRGRETGLHRPGEDNETISCRCGCGSTLNKFDTSGRPRKFISGHNPHPATTINAVLSALSSGPRHRKEIASDLGMSLQGVAVALSRLRAQGRAITGGRGVWARTDEQAEA